MTHSRLLSYIIILVAALLTASCSSSKKAVTVQQQLPKEQPLPQPTKKSAERDRMSTLMNEARKWVGTKYKYGGQSRAGTDCSGMVMALYQQVYDIKLPRSSREQQQYCKSVDRNKLRKGDLLFFSSSKNRNAVSHVGLYIGNNEMIHASTSRGVIVSNLADNYYVRTYHSAGRVVDTKEREPEKETRKDSQSKTPVKAPEVTKTGNQPKSDRNKKTETVRKAKTPPAEAPTIRLEDLINTKIDSIYSKSEPAS